MVAWMLNWKLHLFLNNIDNSVPKMLVWNWHFCSFTLFQSHLNAKLKLAFVQKQQKNAAHNAMWSWYAVELGTTSETIWDVSTTTACYLTSHQFRQINSKVEWSCDPPSTKSSNSEYMYVLTHQINESNHIVMEAIATCAWKQQWFYQSISFFLANKFIDLLRVHFHVWIVLNW